MGRKIQMKVVLRLLEFGVQYVCTQKCPNTRSVSRNCVKPSSRLGAESGVRTDTSATQCRLHWNSVRNNSQSHFCLHRKKISALPPPAWLQPVGCCLHLNCSSQGKGKCELLSTNPVGTSSRQRKCPAHSHTAITIYIKLCGQHPTASLGISHTL